MSSQRMRYGQQQDKLHTGDAETVSQTSPLLVVHSYTETCHTPFVINQYTLFVAELLLFPFTYTLL